VSNILNNHNSVTKIMVIIVMNLITPKFAAKSKLFRQTYFRKKLSLNHSISMGFFCLFKLLSLTKVRLFTV